MGTDLTQSARRVPGHGNPSARILFVGEGPGQTEDLTGLPFQGKSGDLLDSLICAYLMPLGREDVWVTNLVKYRCTKENPRTGKVENREPTQAEIERDAPELLAEIDRIRPGVIVTLGRPAARFFLGDVDMDVCWGRAHAADTQGLMDLLGYQPIIFSLHHPAVGLYSPDMLSFLHRGFEMLGQGLKGTWVFAAQDADPNPAYRDLLDTDNPMDGWDAWWMMLLDESGYLGIDTEGWRHEPWSIQICVDPGIAFIMRRGVADEVIAAFGRALEVYDGTVVAHPLLHEFEVLDAFGIPLADWIADGKVKGVDTSVLAFDLGMEAQGLKPLAKRWAGMEMDSYDELTADANAELAEVYLLRVLELAGAGRLRVASIAACGTGCTRAADCPRPRHQWLDSRFHKALLRCLAKEGKDIRRLWDDQDEDIRDEAFAIIGFDCPDATLSQVLLGRAINYACRDADATRRIVEPLLAAIAANGQETLARIDHLPLPMIADMQAGGMQVDQAHFADLNEGLDLAIATQQQTLDLLVGHSLNPNSGDQVAHELFEVRGLRPSTGRFKYTKGGKISTQDKFLQAIRIQDPIVDQIIDLRELRKLKSTYALRIPAIAASEPDGRLHPHLRVTRVETGRLSATAPNVLAMPKHSDWAKMVSMGFVAGPGRLLGGWDLDQIELRIMAHVSQDPKFLKIFREGKVDLHSQTAHLLLGAPKDRKQQDESLHRLPAKGVNFGNIMGITAHGLLDQLHKARQTQWTLPQVQKLLDDYRVEYAGVYAYILGRHRFTRAHGYTEDMVGRRKYLAGIWSEDEQVRAAAERQAQAIPIQSGAQSVVKQWMAAAYTELRRLRAETGWYLRAWVQVHDALYLELDERLKIQVNQIMTRTIPQTLSVPVTAKGKFGTRWSDL